MSTRQEVERDCVSRLLGVLERPEARLASPTPPAPDVHAAFTDGSAETFEVTEIHPDEAPGQGSAARANEERRAKREPQTPVSSWIRLEALGAIRYRIEQKVEKSSGYAVPSNATLSLLLVGSLPKMGAAAATFVFAPFLSVEQLNGEFDELLANSRFDHAYVHLMLSGNAVWGWSRGPGWCVLRTPDDISHEGRQMLDMLKDSAADGFLPTTTITGRWP
jgi:hypothetical protein